jgi:hypothetical protein
MGGAGLWWVRERLASEVLVSSLQLNTGLGHCAGSLEMRLRNTCNLWALRKTDHPYGMVGLFNLSKASREKDRGPSRKRNSASRCLTELLPQFPACCLT